VLCSSRGEVEGIAGNTESVVSSEELANHKEHYCYICVKKNGADKLCEQNWDFVEQKIISESETMFLDSTYGVEGGDYELEEPSITQT